MADTLGSGKVDQSTPKDNTQPHSDSSSKQAASNLYNSAYAGILKPADGNITRAKSDAGPNFENEVAYAGMAARPKQMADTIGGSAISGHGLPDLQISGLDKGQYDKRGDLSGYEQQKGEYDKRGDLTGSEGKGKAGDASTAPSRASEPKNYASDNSQVPEYSAPSVIDQYLGALPEVIEHKGANQ